MCVCVCVKMDKFQQELDSVDAFLNKNTKKPSMKDLEPPSSTGSRTGPVTGSRTGPSGTGPPPVATMILKETKKEGDEEIFDLTTSELVRCGTCSKICTNLSTFGNHFRKEHCRTAAAAAAAAAAGDDSREQTGSSKPLLLECGRCDFTTTNTTSFSRHKKLHLLPAKDLSFVCPDCPQNLDQKRIFTSKYRLNIHRIKCHRMPYKYNCKLCGKGYMDFGKLKSHASSCTELDENDIPTIDLSKYFK